MAAIVFNIAAGRAVELATRVNANDPANSAFIVLILRLAGLESDAILRDKTTVASLFSGTTREATNVNYARKTLDNTGGIVITVDNVNDWSLVDFPDQSWAAVAAGDVWAKLVVAYDPDTTGGTDADIIPLVFADFAVTPDGTAITAELNALGFFKAAT